jgi:hypothetical protein
MRKIGNGGRKEENSPLLPSFFDLQPEQGKGSGSDTPNHIMMTFS